MRDRREDPKTLSNDLFCMRGVGILLVVFVHVLGVDASHGVRKLFPPNRMDLRIAVELIHSFNMAVMLICSGVAVAAFGRSNLSLSHFLRKKLNKLIVPMLVWAPVLYLMQEFSRGVPHGTSGWLKLLGNVPNTWFPPYAIFWFVHALVGCTLLTWLFQKFATPKLGRWSGPLYFGLALLTYAAVASLRPPLGQGLWDYLSLILYWNRFFALGLLIHPWLLPARQALSRLSGTHQALLPAGLFAIIVLVYAALPRAHYDLAYVINGPLGFCMLFSLATFLRNRAHLGGVIWQDVWSRLTFAGSISMIIYLFHLYFVSGMRMALERWHPETLLAVHLVLGFLGGCIGPWVLFQCFKGHPLFHWSAGISKHLPAAQVRRGQPRSEAAPIPWTSKL
ncbi:acyltransferase [Stigmatella sp. ncwal1]|uniref:Acyltransferase n=1 Tax=Stigmatella ashevillensis TaxID=2995309 RepID=A0ABT5D2V8_9BACT|nr:acyltransferase [Stigmatella ashevillena]MDC0707996.1 acyltransferase [Stigmatella ashevillena]